MDKDIERLYQDKFQDFEVLPDAKVWAGIEESLHNKKRRVLPVWWLTGVAAILIIGLLLFPFGSDGFNVEVKEDIVVTEIKVSSKKDTTTVQKLNTTIIAPNKIVVASNKAVSKKKKSLFKKLSPKTNKIIEVQDNNIANVITKPFLKDEKSTENFLVLKNDKPTIISNSTKVKTQDIIGEELLAKAEEEEDVIPSQSNKWSINPSVAFLSSGSLSKGSPISESLNKNTLEGTKSNSYGIKISYKLNDDWELESGIHIQEIGFNTRDVALVTRDESSTSNINFMDKAVGVTNSELIPIEKVNAFSPDGVDSDKNNLLVKDTSINQSFGYLEFPIEMKYTVLNKSKISTQVVMGFSTLILNKNEISTINGGSLKTIGKADNLNKVNFSGNVGFDVNYKLFNDVKLTLNPMFKVDLNTFSQNSNGFKPYSIGICSGVKYQF